MRSPTIGPVQTPLGYPAASGPASTQCSQLASLCVGEFAWGARRLCCEQAFDTHSLVPLQPTVHRAACDVQLSGEIDDTAALDVSEHGPTPMPLVEVPFLRALAELFIAAHDRAALERICRYMARPPIPQDRLSWRPDGKLVMSLKRLSAGRGGAAHPQELRP